MCPDAGGRRWGGNDVFHGGAGSSAALITDGGNGVVATDGKTIIRAGRYEEREVVDQTGAGDAFGSGFLSQWANGASLRDSVIFASANASSVVQKMGAKSGILHRGVELHTMPISEKAVNIERVGHGA